MLLGFLVISGGAVNHIETRVTLEIDEERKRKSLSREHERSKGAEISSPER
ncbi:MAG: hypothetical protein ACFFAS_18600 [Promethearchaeota archaeon]